MKALVTGSTGMLGHNLVRALLEQGWEVTALVRSVTKAQKLFGNSAHFSKPLEILQGDMENVAGFVAALEGVDAVFHTAAYFREYYSAGEHWPTLKRINIDATLELIAAAELHGVKNFIHVSSSGAIGTTADHSITDETSPIASNTPNLYFKSKVEGDIAIAAWLNAAPRAIKLVSILPGWMMAPRDAAPTASGKLILDFAERKIPGIIDAGNCTVDARDVAAAMIVAIEKGRSGEKYIVAGRMVKFAELFATLERITGVKAPTRTLPNFAVLALARVDTFVSGLQKKTPTMPFDGITTLLAQHHLSSAKAERELGVMFRPLEETLRDTLAWYGENGYLKNTGSAANTTARG
jgi:dihydroflavonol-4-reductase